MIVKNKKERKERNWISFLIIIIFSTILIYYTYNNHSIRVKTIIPFGHDAFLYLFNAKFYFLIIILIFNYNNIYQVLLLFYSLVIPKFLLSIYCLFFEYEKQNNLNMFYDYFILFIFAFILSTIFFDKINDKNIYYKSLCLYIIIFLFLLFCLTNTLAILNSKIIYLDKIISAFILSFSCFYFVFHIININTNDSFQLFCFINNINNNIINVSFFTIIIITIYLKENYEYYKYLSPLLYIASIIIPIYGIIYEFKFFFKSNRKNWSNFNFEKDKDNDSDNINNLISEITITKDIKWNKTSFLTDIFRFLALISFHFGIFYFSESFQVSDDDINMDHSFLYFVFSIFIFMIGKTILYWMRLINMTYFFLERNSINSR